MVSGAVLMVQSRVMAQRLIVMVLVVGRGDGEMESKCITTYLP